MKFVTTGVLALLTFMCGCSKRSFDGWSEAEIVGNTLYIFGHRTKGVQTLTYGMSHKSGFEMTQKVFYVLEYDISRSGDFETPTFARVLFREDPRTNDSEISYRFKALDTNHFLVVRRIPYVGGCVEVVSTPTAFNRRVCVSNSNVGPNKFPDFIFNRSGSHFIANDGGFSMYSSTSMTKEPNSLCDVLAQTNLESEFGHKEIRLSEDLRHLLVFSDKTHVKAFGKNTAPVTFTIPAGNNAEVSDAELVSNRLDWISKGFTTTVGTVGLTNIASISTSSSLAEWDYPNRRVLFIPVTFFTDQQRIDTPLTIWNYNTGTERKVRLSSAEFNKQLGGKL